MKELLKIMYLLVKSMYVNGGGESRKDKGGICFNQSITPLLLQTPSYCSIINPGNCLRQHLYKLLE